jgi:two-component system, cell cycle sensor histidine kinase and response regulator CckA
MSYGSRPPLILNVDDNEDIRRSRSAILAAAGFAVREAQNGTDAVQALDLVQPALVVLDVHMPGLDGFEVCHRIKQNPWTRHIPVLHVTCERTNPTDWTRGLESGADSYLIEPIDPAVLVAVVQALLQRAAAEAATRAADDEARRALEQREQKYRDLFNNATGILYTLDVKGRVTSVNRAAEALTGLRDTEIVGHHFTEFVAPEFLTAMRERFQRELTGQQTASAELEILGAGGARIPIEIHSRPVMRDGHLVEIQGTARDIRERKAMERQLTRTQKLEALGRMAAGIAHDFNNLLTIVGGCTSAALDSLPSNHPARGDVQAIVDATNRGTALARQLLAFGRQQVLQPRHVDFDELVRTTASLVEHLTGSRIRLHLDLQCGGTHIFAEPSQIEQVILNLAINARDAMANGGDLTIATTLLEGVSAEDDRGSAPMQWVALTVSDTGCGIDSETMAHIFEPFFTTKPSDLGTGLGLATVYGIVTQSGGAIDVVSEPGRGTRFTIQLPLAPASVSA